jgi:protochlorophyllide reductase
LFALRGHPHVEPVNEQEENPRTAARLWDLSVELTGVDYAPLQTQQSREAGV